MLLWWVLLLYQGSDEARKGTMNASKWFFFLKAMLIGDSFYLMDILSSKNSSLNGYLAKHVEPTDLTEWNLT